MRRNAQRLLLLLFSLAWGPATPAEPSRDDLTWLGLGQPKGTLKVGKYSDYKTISAAIEAAQPGDVIAISGGSYQEDLVIDKPLHLRPKTKNAVYIMGGIVSAEDDGYEEAQQTPLIKIQAAAVGLYSLRLESFAKRAPALDIEQGSSVRLLDVEIRARNNSALHVSGHTSRVRATNSTFSDSKLGIYASDGAKLELDDCRITYNEQGVEAHEDVEVRARNLQIRGSYKDAFIATTETNFELYRADIQGSGGAGLRISQGAWGKLIDSEIRGCEDGGVDIDNGGPLLLRNNSISENWRNGIAVTNTLGVRLRTNSIEKNSASGVMLKGTKDTELSANSIRENEETGIKLEGTDGTCLVGDKVRSNVDGGVLISGDSFAMLNSLEIKHNKIYGVQLSNSEVIMRNLNISRNAGKGLRISKGCKIDLADTRILENQWGAWSLPPDLNGRISNVMTD